MPATTTYLWTCPKCKGQYQVVTGQKPPVVCQKCIATDSKRRNPFAGIGVANAFVFSPADKARQCTTCGDTFLVQDPRDITMQCPKCAELEILNAEGIASDGGFARQAKEEAITRAIQRVTRRNPGWMSIAFCVFTTIAAGLGLLSLSTSPQAWLTAAAWLALAGIGVLVMKASAVHNELHALRREISALETNSRTACPESPTASTADPRPSPHRVVNFEPAPLPPTAASRADR